MALQRRKVTESLGSSPVPSRADAPVTVKSTEEVALDACHDAARAMWLLFKGPGVTPDEDAELGALVVALESKWAQIGVVVDDRLVVPTFENNDGVTVVEWKE